MRPDVVTEFAFNFAKWHNHYELKAALGKEPRPEGLKRHDLSRDEAVAALKLAVALTK